MRTILSVLGAQFGYLAILQAARDVDAEMRKHIRCRACECGLHGRCDATVVQTPSRGRGETDVGGCSVRLDLVLSVELLHFRPNG